MCNSSASRISLPSVGVDDALRGEAAGLAFVMYFLQRIGGAPAGAAVAAGRWRRGAQPGRGLAQCLRWCLVGLGGAQLPGIHDIDPAPGELFHQQAKEGDLELADVFRLGIHLAGGGRGVHRWRRLRQVHGRAQRLLAQGQAGGAGLKVQRFAGRFQLHLAAALRPVAPCAQGFVAALVFQRGMAAGELQVGGGDDHRQGSWGRGPKSLAPVGAET